MLPILPKKTVSSQVKTKKAPVITRKVIQKVGMTLIFSAAVILIITQGVPFGISFAKSALTDTFSGETHLPVSEAFLQKLVSVKYIDPGKDYFINVVNNQDLEPAKIDTDYTETMRISIPTAKINNIQLAPNIPGSDKSMYDFALKHGVAHLKGTPLPGAGGTSIIYGHSGLSGLFVSPNNPQIIFSRLDAATIGDSMTIKKDSRELQYLITSKKIVEAEDVTFLSDPSHKEKAILITCWPLGIGTRRLVLIAERVYE